MAFSNLPSAFLVPGTYIEISPNSDTAVLNLQTLIIGQHLPTGTAPVNQPYFVGSATEAAVAAGADSMLAQMAAAYFEDDNYGTVYILPLADDPTAAKATGSVTLTGTATSNGAIALYLAGQRFEIGVVVGDTPTVMVSKLVSAFATQQTYFSYSESAGTLTITPANGSLVGDDFDIRVNAAGSLGGEVMPNGVTAAVTAMTGGEVNPVLTAALASLQSEPFEFVIHPYTDAVSLSAIEGFLSDSAGRWSPLQMLYGMAFTAARGDDVSLLALGNSRNAAHSVIYGYNDTPTAPWIAAAKFGAAAAVSIRANVSRPLQGVPLNLPSTPIASRWNWQTTNTLLAAGIAVAKWLPDGSPSICRAVSTYKTNSAGMPDNSYRDITTSSKLATVARTMRQSLATKFEGFNLVPDNSPYTSTSVTSAKQIAIQNLNDYRALEQIGVVTDSASYAKGVQATNAGNGRVNLYSPVTLIGDLNVIGVDLSFSTYNQ